MGDGSRPRWPCQAAAELPLGSAHELFRQLGDVSSVW